MKKVWIWVITMCLISAIFGVQLGLIPGLILSWIISSIVDKNEQNKQEEKKQNDRIKCPKCNSLNEASAEHCANCGALLKENIIDVQANVVNLNEDNEKSETVGDVEEPQLTIESGSFEDKTVNEYFNETETNSIKETVEEEKKDDLVVNESACDDNVVESKTETINNTNNDNSIKYCRYCGAPLKTDAQFCHRCGKQI